MKIINWLEIECCWRKFSQVASKYFNRLFPLSLGSPEYANFAIKLITLLPSSDTISEQHIHGVRSLKCHMNIETSATSKTTASQLEVYLKSIMLPPDNSQTR